MAFLELEHLEKRFGANHVVKDFSLEIGKGEFVSLLGPSGCGKTTVLRMVAGFETPDAGDIRIDGKQIAGLKPNQRNVGMMFQAYALFPNLTVAQNVGFGLKVAGESRAAIDARVTEMLTLIGLSELGGRYPFQLSGGQQQRVALARALAVRPRVLLLDEPLSALDAKIRVSLREEMRAIQQRLGITAIFVTHDQEEALSISDRVVVMHQGVADQIGTPFEIYNRPATRFVAQFVGTLSMLEATVTDQSKGEVEAAGTRISGLKLPAATANGNKLALALRPEAVSLKHAKGDIKLTGAITGIEFLGSVLRMKVSAGGTTIAFDTFNDPATPPPNFGETVSISFDRDSLLVLGEK
jgi:putative spermidine/putrescine transport system ATP-binding protein